MTCRRCHSNNVQIQSVPVMRKRGCLATLLYIFLLCIPVIGWIALFILIRGQKSKVIPMAVCQNCGRQWAI